MPTLKFRIDSNGILSSVAAAMREAADKIAATAHTVAEGEKGVAECADPIQKMRDLIEVAKQAREVIADELKAVDAALAANGSATVVSTDGRSSVTVDDEGITIDAPVPPSLLPPSAQTEMHGAPVPVAEATKPKGKEPRRVYNLHIMVELTCNPDKRPSWRDALALQDLLREAGLFVAISGEMPAMRFEHEVGQFQEGLDAVAHTTRRVLKVECVVERGMTYEERVTHFGQLLAASPFADRFRCHGVL